MVLLQVAHDWKLDHMRGLNRDRFPCMVSWLVILKAKSVPSQSALRLVDRRSNQKILAVVSILELDRVISVCCYRIGMIDIIIEMNELGAIVLTDKLDYFLCMVFLIALAVEPLILLTFSDLDFNGQCIDRLNHAHAPCHLVC